MSEGPPIARFTVICPECVRVEYRRSGRFLEHPSLFASYRSQTGQHWPSVEVRDELGQEPLDIVTERFELRFTPAGRGFTSETLSVQVRGGASWFPGAVQRENLEGTLSTLDGLRRRPRHGLLPGLLARDGWHLVDDSAGYALIDGWACPREQVGVKSDTSDWFLFAYGRDFPAALRALAAVSGRVPMPRKYMLGSWYSRYWPHTSQEYREIVEQYEQHGLPLDVVVLDMDWHREGWTGYSWNRGLLPDAESLLAWLHQRGLAVTLNLHPADGVGPHEDAYDAYMRSMDRDPRSGERVPFDAGDRRQMTALFERVLRPLEQTASWDVVDQQHGADFWWVDWQQDQFVRSMPGLTNLQWLNHLFFTKSARGGSGEWRGAGLSRWAGIDANHPGWGDHRYPMHFSGDAHTGWEMLAFQVPFTVTAGNVGCFYWSHDIGGHFGARIEEATARWVQFGALSAAVRLHSARLGVLDRRPWTYGEAFFESMRTALRRRAELLPYLYTQSRACHEKALPLLRPMYLRHPQEELAYRFDGQYLLGEDLLCAPIVEPGTGPGLVADQVVWFPPIGDSGTRAWWHWRTGECFSAGELAIVAAEIRDTPLFAAAGVPIPVQRAGPRMSGPQAGEILAVRLWPGIPGDSHTRLLYEDDGLTVAHERGQFCNTGLTAEWSDAGPRRLGLRFTVEAAEGWYSGQAEQRGVELQLCGIEAVESVSIHVGSGSVRAEVAPADREGVKIQALSIEPRSIRERMTIDLVLRKIETMELHITARSAAMQAVGMSPDPKDATKSGPTPRSFRALVAQAEKCDDRIRETVLAVGLGIGLRPCLGGCALVDTLGLCTQEPKELAIVDQVGPLRNRPSGVFTGTWAPVTGGPSRSIILDESNHELEEPPLGLRAVRLAHARVDVGAGHVELVAELSTRLKAVPAAAWRAVGPFPWDWSKPITEQRNDPELGKGLGPNHWHDAGNGRWQNWRPCVGDDQWPVELRATLGAHEGLAYAITTIVSSRRQRVRLIVESADRIEVWLNGGKVFSMDGFETQAALDGGAAAELLQGRNSLLVKAASGGGGWGFAIRIDGQAEVAAEAEREEPSPVHPIAG